MKFIKKCPLFILLISSVLLLAILGIAGRMTVYAGLEYNPVKTPVLSLVFTGWNEDIYPWQIFTGEETMSAMAPGENEPGEDVPKEGAVAVESPSPEAPSQEKNPAPAEEPEQAEGEIPAESDAAEPDVSESDSGEVDASEAEGEEGTSPSGSPMPSRNPAENAGRLEPLRESTHEEYLNHISADIYGDAGVLRAAEYEFAKVDESYFDDALFIGDSRTVGLLDYTTLADHADFYCETSLTIYKAMEENFKGKGTVVDALARKDYGKIYIMVGINELGRGTTEDFMSQYTQVVDTLHELEPDALIFIQGIMRVSGQKNSSDAIFNNSNINARNNAIATLADNQQFFYIDINEVVCDEEGNLKEEYTFDQIHLLGMYNDLWKEFLLEHGVVREG